MTFDIFWFLPISGDTRYLGKSSSGRPVNNAYIRQIATTADVLGYDGLLVPTGSSCLDPFITAASLAPITQRIKFLVALRTSIVGSPTVFARQAATLDEALNGRLLLNVVAGGDSVELAADGVFLEHDERYAATDEFLTLWRQLMQGETVTHHGKHYHIENAHNKFSSMQKPYPPLYFGGSSPAAHELAAKQVDVYLTWGEPPALVAEKIKDVRQKAAKLGRTVRFGIRLHVIVRETNAEAWAAADRLIQNLDDATIAKAQEMFANTDSIGQKRMASLHQGKRDNLEISPNLWAGVGLVRGGAGTALVGDPYTIVERMQEYADLGIESFVLSGYPHLEEAVRFAEYVFPLLSGKKSITIQDSSFTGGALDGNSFCNKVRKAS